jgi:hypothetical protein
MNKQKVSISIGGFPIEEMPLDELISKLEGFKANPDDDITVTFEGAYDGYYDFVLMLNREETDEEFEARIEESKKAQRAKTKKEMDRLMKSDTLSEDEKNKLINYIRSTK